MTNSLLRYQTETQQPETAQPKTNMSNDERYLQEANSLASYIDERLRLDDSDSALEATADWLRKRDAERDANTKIETLQNLQHGLRDRGQISAEGWVNAYCGSKILHLQSIITLRKENTDA